jgi:site-specific DNA recombinase
MIAAIYARKSTEQLGVADEQKSVARQVDHARAYAERKGWTVSEEHIFVDDGVSGAEFLTRPGLIRVYNALQPRSPFDVLVMMDSSRLGREMIETSYALLQIVNAGVRVFFYSEDKEATLDSPIEKIMVSLTSFGDELQRERARAHTRDAHFRIARAGRVTGGACFGYRNQEVLGADGRRSHVDRVIFDTEAVVVRRIFTMCADGIGFTTIAKTLNASGAPCPRSQQGRPRGWAPSSIREVLYRQVYRGEIIWNRTTTRKVRGRWRQVPQPEEMWLRVPAPHLRIVTDEQWDDAHTRLSEWRCRCLRLKNGQVLGRPPATGTRYMLSGLLRCGTCGASMEARTRSHGRRRVPFYGCSAHFRKGSSVCSNNVEIPMADAEDAILSTIESYMLDPGIVQEIVETAVATLRADTAARSQRVEPLDRALAEVDGQLARLTDALAAGGDMTSVLTAIRVREMRRDELRRALASASHAGVGQLPDLRAARAELEQRLGEWRTLLRQHVEQAQQLLRRLIDGRLTMTPGEDQDGRYYRFTGAGSWWRLLAGLGPTWRPIVSALRPQKVASPTGFDASYKVFRGEWIDPRHTTDRKAA